MKVFVQLGAAVLAALAIVPTPGTEGAAISYGKRVKCAWYSPFFHGRIQNLTSLRLNFYKLPDFQNCLVFQISFRGL